MKGHKKYRGKEKGEKTTVSKKLLDFRNLPGEINTFYEIGFLNKVQRLEDRN